MHLPFTNDHRDARGGLAHANVMADMPTLLSIVCVDDSRLGIRSPWLLHRPRVSASHKHPQDYIGSRASIKRSA